MTRRSHFQLVNQMLAMTPSPGGRLLLRAIDACAHDREGSNDGSDAATCRLLGDWRRPPACDWMVASTPKTQEEAE